MKTCFKRLLPLLLVLALPAVVQAQFNYRTNDDNTITITGYSGSGGAVTIPDTINVGGTNLPVTSIWDSAFDSCTSLTSVTIGTNVTSIGIYAFHFCAGLTSLTIPNSVTSIGGGAFLDCISLTNVTIGNGLTSIPELAFEYCTSLASVAIGNSVTNIWGNAFDSCTSLTAITVDSLNSVYSSVDGVLFDKSQTTLIQCPEGKAGSYTISNSVTSIADGAFSGCTSLANVMTGNGVTNIGDSAFSGCTSLTNVMIGSSVTSIGGQAFYSCTSLRSVTIDNSVTNIAGQAFSHCTSLTSVYFQGNAPSLGAEAFFYIFHAISGDVPIPDPATVYYLPETTGWDTTFGGRPTALWLPQMQTSGTSFGMQTNQFGFNINWASGMTVAVEACTNLANPIWCPLQTNTLSGDSFYFSDPQWTNYPGRFYRIRSP